MAKLTAIQALKKYQELTTEPIISDAIYLTAQDSETGQRRAAAAVLGFSRGKHYLDTARSLIDQVGADASEISFRMLALEAFMQELHSPNADISETDLRSGASHSPVMHALSVHSEVLWHLYAICLDSAWHFMVNCVESLGLTPPIDATTKREIDIVRGFRNHMEHRDKAAKNIRAFDWNTLSRIDGDALLVGYNRDSQNNISFVPTKGPLSGQSVAMAMNPAGFQRFNDIIASLHAFIRAEALSLLWAKFLADPDSIPDESDIGGSFQEGIEPAI